MDSFEKLLSAQDECYVIDKNLPYNQYVSIDLSVDSDILYGKKLLNSQDYTFFIAKYLHQKNATVGYGGYLEKRNLYRRSSIFNSSYKEERNIHIGLDLWTKAETPVLAALDGVVHSFQNNKALGDYGPTIILKHTLNNCEFYTLYGHLSLESIALLKINQKFKKGEPIAYLGETSVNGDYAPHLHFQIIKDIEEFYGDYPGVCSEKELIRYKNNCPNPNLLLKI
ncbi:MAG: peptidoglycan DD-metalloendopeptidase family protein [Flavobacterium sp.]|uniref:peptidoglycan DD-metalloendopeptidase family protein n=1 Tax=Flavobacterium sp. TaxID=239 RepID=UPI001DE1B65F|nr:peptidoglycan DD-metalloendopeptidase family protein [Flavobacterium sp.]